MTFKDKIALIISILALALSGLTFYFSQLRTSYVVEAVVLESDPGGGILSYQVAILNQGTHRVIVTDAILQQVTSDNVLSTLNPLANVEASPSLPAVVEARDLLILRFHGPVVLPALYDRGSPADAGQGNDSFDGQPTRHVLIRAHIRAIDFVGRPYALDLGAGDLHITRISVATWRHPQPARAVFTRTESGA